MSIRSMTGYGSSERCARGRRVAVELVSVNHKQFDLRIIPSVMPADVESRVRDMIHKRVERGFVTCRVKISFDMEDNIPAMLVDESLAGAYVKRLECLAGHLGLRNDLSISVIAQMPGVIRSSAPDDDIVSLQPLLFDCLKRALSGLIDMRDEEGKALLADIERRMTALDRIADRIKKRSVGLPKRQMKALLGRIKDSGLAVKQNDPRLVREVALFADRCDISEEIVRLRSHMKQLAGKLAVSGSVGRTIDFILQEMHREINTVGSKANDGKIGSDVIQFKSELERVREQVQNVE